MNTAPDMDAPVTNPGLESGLGTARAAVLVVVAVLAFQLAFEVSALCGFSLVYLGSLFALRRIRTPRQAFYSGLLVGLGVFVPQMLFLWRIFSVAALPLWLILAFFHGLFLLVLNRVQFRCGSGWALVLAPVLWCGIEYFRCEVWWLRFSWFAAGTCLPPAARGFLVPLGVYGCGALGMAVGALGCHVVELRGSRWPTWMRPALVVAVGVMIAGIVGSRSRGSEEDSIRSEVHVAGVQMEFPGVPEVRMALERVRTNHADAGLVLLSEYTFDGGVPDTVKAWCRRHEKWLVAGGREPVGAIATDQPSAPEGSYFNTAFVVSPQGEVVFTQAKSRPIQFFQDGLPARQRRVWDSPWGRLAIPICYDASYRRVMDDFVRQGVQGFLIPTMDVEAWGERQHRLNARMARLRSVEYQVPVFRVASSGISQLIDATGYEIATAPFPGPGEMIAGTMALPAVRTRRPIDAMVAPACTVGTGGIIGFLVVAGFSALMRRRRDVPGPGALPSSFPLSL